MIAYGRHGSKPEPTPYESPQVGYAADAAASR
jgi:hypothetical protein